MHYSMIAPGAVSLLSKVDGVDIARGKDDRNGGLRPTALAGPRSGGGRGGACSDEGTKREQECCCLRERLWCSVQRS